MKREKTPKELLAEVLRNRDKDRAEIRKTEKEAAAYLALLTRLDKLEKKWDEREAYYLNGINQAGPCECHGHSLRREAAQAAKDELEACLKELRAARKGKA